MPRRGHLHRRPPVTPMRALLLCLVLSGCSLSTRPRKPVSMEPVYVETRDGCDWYTGHDDEGRPYTMRKCDGLWQYVYAQDTSRTR